MAFDGDESAKAFSHPLSYLSPAGADRRERTETTGLFPQFHSLSNDGISISRTASSRQAKLQASKCRILQQPRLLLHLRIIEVRRPMSRIAGCHSLNPSRRHSSLLSVENKDQERDLEVIAKEVQFARHHLMGRPIAMILKSVMDKAET